MPGVKDDHSRWPSCLHYILAFVSYAGCDGKADIVFLLDASGSIHHERFPIVQDFVKQIVESLEISETRARVALLSWSNSARLDFLLNRFKSKQDVIQAVQYIEYIGEKTHTASALRMMREQVFSLSNGDREDVPNFAFIITDGNSNINEEKTIEEAIRARQAGIHVFVVSVGKQINIIELKGMASEPVDDNIYKVDRFQDLRTIIELMPSAICNGRNPKYGAPEGSCKIHIIAFPRNPIAFPRNNIAFSRNIIPFSRNTYCVPRNTCAFSRNTIAFS